MKKLIFLFLLSVGFSHAQTVDTSTTAKKASYWLNQTAKYRILSLPDRVLSNSLRSIQNLAISRTPYLTISQLRAGEADNAVYVNVTEGGRSGIFVYDASDVTSADDTSMILRSGAKRYVRLMYDNNINPRWFGALGNGTANDTYRMQLAFNWASAKNKNIEIQYGLTFLINGQVNVGCSVSGFGMVKTRAGGKLVLSKPSLTIRDITINGRDETNSNAIVGGSIQGDVRSNTTIDNVKIYGVVGQGIWMRTSHNSKVVNCIIDGVRGGSGDAVYFNASNNCYVAGNTMSDFQRIGVTFEGGSYLPQVIGNSMKNAFPQGGSQINGAVWFENTYGGVIIGNTSENTRDRNIVVTPNVSSGKSYNYTVSNNTCIGGTNGLSFVFAESQNIKVNGNSFIDNTIAFETGAAKSIHFSNNGFYKRDSSESVLSELIRLVPTVVTGNLTNVIIEDCYSERVLKANLRAINIPNTSGFKANLTIRDCVGNFSVLTYANATSGTARYENVTMDYSNVDNTSTYLANFTIGTFFEDCTLKFAAANNFIMQGLRAEFARCEISSVDSPVRLQVGTFGVPYVSFRNCRTDKVILYNIRKTGTSVVLLNNEISGYESAGFIDTVVQQLAYLDLRGNRFTSATHPTAIPIQLVFGVADSDIGINSFRSTVVTTAANPHYLQPETMSSNSTVVPPKTSLNNVYGNMKGGSTVLYENITSGARSYFKKTDSNTSDWRYTIYSTGEQGTAP